VFGIDTKGVFLFGIEDDNVGVGSDGDRSLLWEQPEYLRGAVDVSSTKRFSEILFSTTPPL
jgi:hypothetical protein